MQCVSAYREAECVSVCVYMYRQVHAKCVCVCVCVCVRVLHSPALLTHCCHATWLGVLAADWLVFCSTLRGF